MTTTRLHASIGAAALLTLTAAAAAHAQTPTPPAPAASATTDARWTPWLGCWRATDDPGNTGARVCVTRAGNGVSVRTIVGGQLVSDEVRVADGAPRPVREAGCTGTETTRWAADGQRAYRTAQASCGSEAARTLASVAYFVPGPVWIDVQAVTLEGATNVRVTGYTRAANQRLPDGTVVPQAPAGMAASLMSRGWTTDEVVEASAVLPPDGVQAAISEGPTAFRLNAKSLAQLADGARGRRRHRLDGGPHLSRTVRRRSAERRRRRRRRLHDGHSGDDRRPVLCADHRTGRALRLLFALWLGVEQLLVGLCRLQLDALRHVSRLLQRLLRRERSLRHLDQHHARHQPRARPLSMAAGAW